MFNLMQKRIIYAVALPLLALLLVACGANAGQPAAAPVEGTNSRGITVVGRGEAYGRPDQARVQIGVETFAEDVSEATSQNEADVQSIMAALEEQGIASEDIQTSNYNLWAEQSRGENGPEGITGYRVSNLVTVTLRDIEAVGDVIAAATEAGANNVHGISFSVADPAGLEADARQSAITDAREKAASLADLSAVELGEVIAVSEVIGQPGPFARGFDDARAVAEEAAAPSISPGELSYTVQVQVTFAIR